MKRKQYDKTTTCRGFGLIEFTDSKGVKCNVQESSAADDSYIWLGAEDIGLKKFTAHVGWHDVKLVDTMEEHYIANNRMHLNRKQAKMLVKILKKFVKTGSL